MKALQNKIAIIYGAGGSIGGAVAKAFASAGAHVFLTGKNLSKLQIVADEISKKGGIATTNIVDAFDELAVKKHIEMVRQNHGAIDISFNAVSVDIVMNVPLVSLSTEDFVKPIASMMQTQFITAKEATLVMSKEKKGVILTITATPGGIGYPFNGGFAPACSALENFTKNLAIETGIHGVRVVNIRSGGSPDSKIFKEAMETNPAEMIKVISQMEADTILKELPLMNDVAALAVFLASDAAAKITGTTLDITCGTTAGLNYRVVK